MTTTKKTAVKKEKEVIVRQPYSRGYTTVEDFESQTKDINSNISKQYDLIYRNNETIMSRTQYQGWLVSPQIWKRSLAVVGHVALFNLVVYIPILFLILILG